MSTIACTVCESAIEPGQPRYPSETGTVHQGCLCRLCHAEGVRRLADYEVTARIVLLGDPQSERTMTVNLCGRHLNHVEGEFREPDRMLTWTLLGERDGA